MCGHAVSTNQEIRQHRHMPARLTIRLSLAYCELHIGLAALALRALPHMKLHNTSVSDVAYDHDQLISMPRTGSRGVQITIYQ